MRMSHNQNEKNGGQGHPCKNISSSHKKFSIKDSLRNPFTHAEYSQFLYQGKKVHRQTQSSPQIQIAMCGNFKAVQNKEYQRGMMKKKQGISNVCNNISDVEDRQSLRHAFHGEIHAKRGNSLGISKATLVSYEGEMNSNVEESFIIREETMNHRNSFSSVSVMKKRKQIIEENKSRIMNKEPSSQCQTYPSSIFSQYKNSQFPQNPQLTKNDHTKISMKGIKKININRRPEYRNSQNPNTQLQEPILMHLSKHECSCHGLLEKMQQKFDVETCRLKEIIENNEMTIRKLQSKVKECQRVMIEKDVFIRNLEEDIWKRNYPHRDNVSIQGLKQRVEKVDHQKNKNQETNLRLILDENFLHETAKLSQSLDDSNTYFLHPCELKNLERISDLFERRKNKKIRCYVDDLNQLKYQDTNTFVFDHRGDTIKLTEEEKRYYLDRGFLTYFHKK